MRTTVATAGSTLFFVAAPGLVAGLVPYVLTGWESADPLAHWWIARVVGAGLLAVGVAVLVSSFVSFVVEGRGTPAPVAPTDRLVVGGLYRYVRNPMYVAVTTTIVGQALLIGKLGLVAYAAVVATAMTLFTVGYEQPVLERRYGAQYAEYRRAVRAWWPRRHPWPGPNAGTFGPEN